ncbi:Alpha/beta hydrolase family-domain-containing protein [Coprinopsis sp. MPI-PUGE-AT-0042]|nr:Alpha/beta hydrolase family-domain-containing protein [Coprinopsis sp. MPI-PUGE-AT-0042]
MSPKHASYPQVSQTPWEPVDVRPLPPIYPPPEPLEFPDLPTPQRTPIFSAPFDLTTHIIPACYLRRGRFAPVLPPPPRNASKEERAKILSSFFKEIRFGRGPMKTEGYPKVLWNVLNRYVRKGLKADNSTGLTLFFAHANGFNKEIWEPTLGVLLDSPSGKLIDEVWVWESVQHGDAALINRDSLSRWFDWSDNTRDIVNFLTNFLPSRATSERLPLHLRRLPEEESNRRREKGFAYRRLMQVGHSYGGCTSACAVENFPKLFDSLVLIDPVIAKPSSVPEVAREVHERTDLLLKNSLVRRDTWSSREEALEGYLKSPFFRAWHPSTLRVYVDAGMYETVDDEGKPVIKLKMPGIYESIVFAERQLGHEVYNGLAQIEERIPIHWVMPGRDDADEFGPPGASQQRVWARLKNATNVRITGAGHLIAQERPEELAENLHEFIQRHYADLATSSHHTLRSNL